MPCRLCGNPIVYDINSHFTPRAISQTTFGKVGHELIHTIDLKAGIIDVFHGRAHPEGKPDVIKPLPNTAKGVFCKRCEDGFGLLESICQPLLAKYMLELQTDTLALKKIEKGLIAFDLPVHINIFTLFFLTVIWRQCLSSDIEVGCQILPIKDFDNLQKSIFAEIHKTKKQIEESTEFVNYPLVTVFTAPNRKETGGFVNPSGISTNPEVFFIGDYSCLFFKNAPMTSRLFKILGVPFALQQVCGERVARKNSRVIVIEDRFYNDIIQHSIKYNVNKFFEIHITKIAQFRGIGLGYAQYLLKQTAMRFYIQNNMKDYTECLLRASEVLCSQR